MYRVILEELNLPHFAPINPREVYRSEELGLCKAYCCANKPDGWAKLTIQKEVVCWENVKEER